MEVRGCFWENPSFPHPNWIAESVYFVSHSKSIRSELSGLNMIKLLPSLTKKHCITQESN